MLQTLTFYINSIEMAQRSVINEHLVRFRTVSPELVALSNIFKSSFFLGAISIIKRYPLAVVY